MSTMLAFIAICLPFEGFLIIPGNHFNITVMVIGVFYLLYGLYTMIKFSFRNVIIWAMVEEK